MNNVVPNPEDNSPGIYKIGFVPVVDVLSIPKAQANGYIVDPVLLREGALWNEIHVTVDANNFDLNNGKSAEGNTNAVAVTGFVAGDAPWLVTTLQTMADYEDYIIVVTDANDMKRLVGSIEYPAKFDYKLAYNGRRGYTLLFKCTSPQPPYYYQSPVVAYPDSIVVDPTFMNLDAYIAQYMEAFDLTKVNRAGDGEITGLLFYKTLLDVSVADEKVLVHKKYVDEVVGNATPFIYFDSLVDFPEEGAANKVYVANDTLFAYIWNGATYVLFIYRLEDSDDLAEGTINRYYTEAREDALIEYIDDADDVILQGAKDYADALVVGLWDDRGSFDASVNAYPSAGGSGVGGAILKGDIWTVSVIGTLPTGQIVELGDTVRAIVDTPGNTQANWSIQNNNIGYVPENTANKSNDIADFASATKYPVWAAIVSFFSATKIRSILGITTLSGSNTGDQDLSSYAVTSTVTAGLATKATINGDAPAGTWRVGTTNAQSAAIRTNGVDRLTIYASGNIVQAGSTSLYDIVKLRIRDAGASFKEVFSSSVTNVLTFASGWTEVNFNGAWTQLKGTNSRLVEVDASGVQSAVEEIIPFFIYNPTVQALLSSSLNWSKANVYTGTSLSAFLLNQGQFYRDSLYEYTMYSTTEVVRKPLYRVARRLYNDYVVKNLTVSANAYTYVMPANTLFNLGDSIEVEMCSSQLSGGGGAGGFSFKLNGSSYSGGYSDCVFKFKFIKVGLTDVVFTINRSINGEFQNIYTGSDTFALDEDFTFSVDGTGVFQSFQVDFKPSV